MDILISFILLLIAVLLFLQKPIKIEVKHVYPEIPQASQNSQDSQKIIDEEKEKDKPVSMDNLLHALNDVMGVNNNE